MGAGKAQRIQYGYKALLVWFNLCACVCVCVCVCVLSHVCLFVILWTVACQGPLSLGFSRQE